MTFLNPWLLGGVAAIGAPIIIHMMMRRRVRRIKWAAMRFLKTAVQRNERRLRIEDWLLLAVRCLLLILLALALARPAFRNAGMGMGGGARTAVIALDNSYSMGLTDGGASRFDNGKKAAGQIIDSLPAGSRVAVLFFSNVMRPAIPEPATDLNLVRRTIGEAQLTDRGTDVHPALREAMDILKRHAAGGGDIFLITDGQATGWRDLAAMRDEVTNAGAHVVIVEPGPGGQPNLGVSSLAPSSPMVAVGAGARFTAQVTNYGRDEARNVTVGLSIDGEAPGDQAVIESLPAGESRAVSLFGKMRSAGYHAVTAQLPPDHLAADDRRTIVVRAVAEARVLLAVGDVGAEPRDGDAFFLERALAPVAPEDRDKCFIKTQTVAASDLRGAQLANFDAVALVNVPSLDAQTAANLETYVRSGGGLMIFPGEKTDAAAYNDTLGGGVGLLPATLGDAWGDAQGQDKFRTLQGPPYTDPIVSLWQDPAAGTLTTARFYKGLALELPPPPGPFDAPNPDAGKTVTVLDYADGSPAIVERTFGRGLVIEFSSSGNAAWNDLPAHPAFVPLMQRVLGRLVTRRDEGLNIPVGSPFIYSAPADWLYKDVVVSRAGAPETATTRVELSGGQPLLRYEDTDHAGAYDVTIETEPPVKMQFAAQADPAESNLDPVPDMELKTLGPGTEVIHWDAGSRAAPGWTENGREIWALFAALALAAACFESYLAGRFSAAK